uniref:Uncharacterized protein n=1 Tax=Glossina austeni TaxID=7395 RepID=A0A1A9VTD7_GLOAU
MSKSAASWYMQTQGITSKTKHDGVITYDRLIPSNSSNSKSIPAGRRHVLSPTDAVKTCRPLNTVKKYFPTKGTDHPPPRQNPTLSENADLLESELLDAGNKLRTLIPRQNRKRRGLINGTMSKPLLDAMGEQCRQNTQNHLLNIDEIKENNKQQTLVNDYFNETISAHKTGYKER